MLFSVFAMRLSPKVQTPGRNNCRVRSAKAFKIKYGILFSATPKTAVMIDPVRKFSTEIDYRGNTLSITMVQGETFSNGWIDFGVKSEDDTFLHVFGKNPVPLMIKPKQEFKAEYDLFQNTPEQRELVKEIWDAIQRIYF